MEHRLQPNLFLIGGMRCGSTSLHWALHAHPEIFMSGVKEPYFYVAEAMRRKQQVSASGGDASAALSDFVAGGKYREIRTYRSLFQNATEQKYLGESSHYIYHPNVAPVIFSDCANARIIISLRDPTDRLHSEYMLYRRNGRVNSSFRDFVYKGISYDSGGHLHIDPKRSRISKGFYYRLVKDWISTFGRHQVKIILFEEFIRDYEGTLTQLHDWLGIDTASIPSRIHAQSSGVPSSRRIFSLPNRLDFIKAPMKRVLPKSVRIKLRSYWYDVTLNKESIEPDMRAFLDNIYKEDISQLEDELGLDLTLWH